MLPSDEKSPALGMPQPAEPSKVSTGPLQNPLHEMYSQSLLKNEGATNTNSVQHIQTGRMPGPSTANTQQQTLPSNPAAHAAAMASSPAGHADSIADEEVWVERTKAAIAQTQNDPYRRVQVLQGLRVSYQTERFNKDTNGTSGS